MKLTRRDALVGAAGIAAVGGLGAYEFGVSADSGADALDDGQVESLQAVADVVYPPDVEVTPSFVQGFARRLSPERRGVTLRTLDELDQVARGEYGRSFHRLPRAQRDSLLRELGVDRVESDSEGTLAERTRYHLVNSLLYAVLTTPRGTRLYGIENPRGYAGGFASNEFEI